MHLKEKPITGLMIIKEAKSFYDEMKVTDKCTFSEDSNKTGILCINVTLRCMRITIVVVER
jgi:hypothetical protein